ncbi:MAG: polyprenyl diphosphate synthase [Enterobacteriaceae bacterium]
MINKLPKHVAIIMDGNGRWALLKKKLRIFGYEAGVNSAIKAIKFALDNNLKMLTLYAFSTENWKRPIKEVSFIMKLFLKILRKKLYFLKKNNIKLKIIGNISRLNENLRKYIYLSEKHTKKNNGLYLNIAVNYGGQWDITEVIKYIGFKIKKKKIHPSRIDENLLHKIMEKRSLIQVDLLIRTGGEYRLSNFLLWQLAYTELFFTDVLWPDFKCSNFKHALNIFSKRKRRFGNI